jgi:hypothetical protein
LNVDDGTLGNYRQHALAWLEQKNTLYRILDT